MFCFKVLEVLESLQFSEVPESSELMLFVVSPNFVVFSSKIVRFACCTVTSTTTFNLHIININTDTHINNYGSVNSSFHTKTITTTNAHTKQIINMLAGVQSTIILLTNYSISCLSSTSTPIDTIY